jgi:polygalacturonase
MPTFPLNTDGIDPAGSNVVIRNVKITSYDDSIAVKPVDGSFKVAKCAENILAENVTTWMGIGMVIGSVPPNKDFTCIRNVTFRNMVLNSPIKSIYMKTNPGEVGGGIIENILYENFTITAPLWWNIYIGPQQ